MENFGLKILDWKNSQDLHVLLFTFSSREIYSFHSFLTRDHLMKWDRIPAGYFPEILTHPYTRQRENWINVPNIIIKIPFSEITEFNELVSKTNSLFFFFKKCLDLWFLGKQLRRYRFMTQSRFLEKKTPQTGGRLIRRRAGSTINGLAFWRNMWDWWRFGGGKNGGDERENIWCFGNKIWWYG